MNIIEQAKKIRADMNVVTDTLTDAQGLNLIALFESWTLKVYSTGSRVQYNGKLYKCLTAHTAQESWMPDVSPSLWAEILAGQSGTGIGEWKQPNSTNPYMMGDRVLYSGKTYQSTIDSNIWAPGVYGWIEVSD